MHQSTLTNHPHRAATMRYIALCIPLIIASMVLALVTVAEARTLPDESPASSELSHRANTVSVPGASNFVVGSIVGQPQTTRYYDFVVSEMKGAPDGFTKNMLVVNGVFPGPTIEANQGDRLVVKVTNQMSNRTSIHWHGILQNGTNYYDGTAAITECGIPTGESLTYDFLVDTFSGTTWWHPDEPWFLDGTEYTDGIEGALIVHPRSYPPHFPTWDEDLVIELADVYHTFSGIIAAELTGGTGSLSPLEVQFSDSGVINGIGQYNGSTNYFNFDLKPNKTYRLRLINEGSEAEIRFSVDHHPLTVIEADGTLIEPQTVTGVTLGVAQRYSVLITTNQTAEPQGNYWMRAELITLGTLPGSNSDIRGIIRYGNSKSLPTASTDPGVPGSGLSDLDTATLVPAIVKTPPNSTKSYVVHFTLAISTDGGAIAFMNGTSWQPLTNTSTLSQIAQKGQSFAPEGPSVQFGDQFMITEDSIEVVDLLLVNDGPGEHPFHFHGHTPFILGSNTGIFDGTGLNTVNPMYRDTYFVPGTGWLLLRFVTDNPGIWTFHCHIAWHMAIGLLMQINSLPSKAAKFDIPQTIIDQCRV
ncbi:uncharacterized protein PHACADRAFT_149761 [Phanerochaete carnosa HHB-10118-sp]|uniref:laccase n=1 Tax=Phanerochaete carnosa (strain HHB-10118-sp) TaxID=650164 RepID=K5WR66_PHACS|nr:uncharacterized protein PHACADRAFT_149761 [Phanerochaete carnosa HHB-10118-sp]EKM52837.1 hypothetical protein PHACADRAFT_149761 [Phanerochaete carnosa HHB-10118-sp]